MLEQSGIAAGSIQDARRNAMGGEETWQLLRKAEEVVVGKGKNIVRLQPRQAGKDAVLAEVLGRSGTLRAPTLRLGSSFLCGWNDALYATWFPVKDKE